MAAGDGGSVRLRLRSEGGIAATGGWGREPMFRGGVVAMLKGGNLTKTQKWQSRRMDMS